MSDDKKRGDRIVHIVTEKFSENTKSLILQVHPKLLFTS